MKKEVKKPVKDTVNETKAAIEEKMAKSAETVIAEAEKVEKKAVETVKSAVKNAPKKAAAATKKTAVKETVYLQYLGKEINKEDIVAQVKEVWTKQMKRKVSDIKSITLYLKPEENAAYFVINDDATGKVEL